MKYSNGEKVKDFEIIFFRFQVNKS